MIRTFLQHQPGVAFGRTVKYTGHSNNNNHHQQKDLQQYRAHTANEKKVHYHHDNFDRKVECLLPFTDAATF